MTTKPNALIQAACISLLLMLVPGTAVPQERKEPAAGNQSENTVQEPAQQTPGSLSIPGGNSEQQPAEQKPAASQAPAPAQEPSGPAKEESAEYIIKRGDTLWDISNTFYKDPFLWPFIWKANPYVTNADLIYPGNKLVIPSLAPIERAIEAPEEQVVEKEVPQEPVAREGIAGAGVRPKAPPAVSEEKAPSVGGRLILPEEQALPAVDKYAMLSAGFVNDEENVGSIVGTEERKKTTLGYDDVVYVKMRSPETVNIGDKFLIYTPLGRVKHPKRGGSYGRLIRGLGILEITAKDPAADVLTARITLSFSDIAKHDRLTPYQEPVLVYRTSEKKSKDIWGYILEVTDHRRLVGQTDFVYLDKGRADGVEPGDTFIVYAEPEQSGFPRKMIGEVLVFLVKERTSTAVVWKSREPLARGDAVDYKK